jgi:quercetin dioxygenase-like cupin family protein
LLVAGVDRLGRCIDHRSARTVHIVGQVELELDDGIKELIGPGAVIVQRGTIHLWRNPSATDICSIVFVLIEALAYRHEGEPLPER